MHNHHDAHPSAPQTSPKISDAELIDHWLESFASDLTRRRFAPTSTALLIAMRAHGVTLTTATRNDVHSLVQVLAAQAPDPRRCVAQIASLLSYARHHGYIRYNPLQVVRVRRPPQRARARRINPDEFARLCCALNPRDRTLAHCIYIAGVCPEYIIGLTWREATERGGRENQNVNSVLPRDLALALSRLRGSAPDDALVFSTAGRRPTMQALNSRLKRAARRAGLPRSVTSLALWRSSCPERASAQQSHERTSVTAP